jgi:hypothetical protein
MSQAALDIPVSPWFADHRVNGRVVLPAVESMLLLAAGIAAKNPELDIRVMEDVRFSKFLEIPGGSALLAALIEYRQGEKGSIRASLLSRMRLSSMTRLQEHGSILFSPGRPGTVLAADMGPSPLSGAVTRFSAREVYSDLVPFGSSYQTLRESLYITEEGAWARLRAPRFAAPGQAVQILGSPFPLDGAFHAACVLGRRAAGFIPFPVGFTRRVIAKPTQAGAAYLTRVKLVSRQPDELVFDLCIFDRQGEVYESVTGLRMRDVSGQAGRHGRSGDKADAQAPVSRSVSAQASSLSMETLVNQRRKISE